MSKGKVKKQKLRNAIVARPSRATPDGSLGELGTDRGTVDLHFQWFGTKIRVNPGAGELELQEFLMEAENIEVPEDDADLAKSVPAMRSVYKFLQAQIHPDDWALFFDIAKTRRQNTLDLMKVAMTIVEELANFPTGPSGDSGAGTAPTSTTSKDGLPSQESRALSVTRRALAEVPVTRPDLMAAYVMRAQEAGL